MSTENRLETMTTLQDTLKEIVEKNPMAGRHSYFQLKYFVVGKEPTIQAKLWQCLREMKARKETLEAIGLERDDTRDRIELTEIELEAMVAPSSQFGIDLPTDELSKRELAVKTRQVNRRLSSLKKALTELDARQRETEEEAAFFLQAFEELEKVEPVKSYDDLDAQREYWSQRFSNELNMKLMLEHRIDAELAKAVLSLPDNAGVKQELVGILNQHQLAIEEKKKQMLIAQGANG